MNERQPPIDYIERTQTQYEHLGYPPYKWVAEPAPPPFATVRKPMSQARVGLVASGGIYEHGQIAFHYRDDVSFRVVATDSPTSQLRATHFAYDLTDARRDPNVVFPVDTLRALADEGTIGAVSPRAYTFMGGIYSARKVREMLAPAIAEKLQQDEVDVVLMVPV